MAMPCSGQISMDQIRQELGLAGQTDFSLNTAEDGAYVPITPFASSVKPNPANPASISEWYCYKHTIWLKGAQPDTSPYIWYATKAGLLNIALWGGGGGGGGAFKNTLISIEGWGEGGGGGGFLWVRKNVTLGEALFFYVGVGGVRGPLTSTSNNGGNGGTTSVNLAVGDPYIGYSVGAVIASVGGGEGGEGLNYNSYNDGISGRYENTASTTYSFNSSYVTFISHFNGGHGRPFQGWNTDSFSSPYGGGGAGSQYDAGVIIQTPYAQAYQWMRGDDYGGNGGITIYQSGGSPGGSALNDSGQLAYTSGGPGFGGGGAGGWRQVNSDTSRVGGYGGRGGVALFYEN